MGERTARITFEGVEVECPVIEGSEGERMVGVAAGVAGKVLATCLRVQAMGAGV